MDLSKHQILEPLSSMIELSLLSFSKNKPKLSIKHHGIMINNSGEGYIPRNVSRFIFGDSKEDLTILHPMILNYLNWFIIDDRSNSRDIYYIYKNIAICAVHGLKKLQGTYKIGNVVFALQYYINLILKTLVDIDETRDSNAKKTIQHVESILPQMEESLTIDPIMTSSQLLTSYCDNNENNEYRESEDLYHSKKIDISELNFTTTPNSTYRSKTYFTNYGIINDSQSLMKWSIPNRTDISLVDTEKIKTIWNIEDLKNIYDMLQGCFDMSIDYEFIPKSDSVVEAKVKALKDVLCNKDNEFHLIIKNSYGGN